MGTALRNLKDEHKGKKHSDGKTIGKKGRPKLVCRIIILALAKSAYQYWGNSLHIGAASTAAKWARAARLDNRDNFFSQHVVH